MGLRSVLQRAFSRAPQPAAAAAPRPVSNAENRKRIQARFDVQFTTDQNRELWGLADAMSIDASANWQVRRQMRMRSRYEYHNNSFYQGVADTIGNYVIGVGPQLQMLTTNKRLNTLVEKLWNEWSKEIGLAAMLKNSRVARVHSGEGIGVMRHNPGLDSPVKLDVAEVECDRLTSPLFGMYPSQYPDQFFDGIQLNPWGRPQTYHILRQHPGAFGAFVLLGNEFDAFPARYVLHDYKPIRPEQRRGIPEALPAVPTFAELRRFGGAVLGAAETAAANALTIESESPAGGEDDEDAFEPLDKVELRRREATVLPAGWKQSQMKAEQPTTTYDAFMNAKLTEVARCLNIPLFFITLDGRLVNMSSAYVVTQPFAKSVGVDRLGYNILLGRVVDEFLTEAIRVPGLLPKDIPSDLPHTFRWPKIGEHADPNKVARGRSQSLADGTTSIPQVCAEDGLNWEEVQVSAAKSLGMSLEEYRAALRQKMFAASGNPVPASTDDEPTPIDPESPDPDPPEDLGDQLEAMSRLGVL